MVLMNWNYTAGGRRANVYLISGMKTINGKQEYRNGLYDQIGDNLNDVVIYHVDQRPIIPGTIKSFCYEDRTKFITEHTKNFINNKRIPQINEVTPDGLQKFKVDFDLKKSEFPRFNDEDIGPILMDFVSESPINFDYCLYCPSIDPSGQKVSVHLIFGFYVADASTAEHVYKEWMKDFIRKYPNHVRTLTGTSKGIDSVFDSSVYSAGREFRMLYCDKVVENKDTNGVTRSTYFPGRVKTFGGMFRKDDFGVVFYNEEQYREEVSYNRMITSFERHILELSLITNISDCRDNEYRPPCFDKEDKNTFSNEPLSDSDEGRILDLLKKHHRLGQYDFKIYEVKEGVIWFQGRSYSCPLCHLGNGGCHDSQPASCFVRDGTVYFSCNRRKFGSPKCTVLGRLTRPVLDDTVIELDDNFEEVKPKTTPAGLNKDKIVFGYIETIRLSDKYIIPGEWVPEINIGTTKTLFIRAPTGRGKTTSVRELIKKHTSHAREIIQKYPTLTFALVSPRISWCDAACGELAEHGIEHVNYRDKQHEGGVYSDYKVLVISAESFYRTGVLPDVLIIDEVESINQSFFNEKIKKTDLAQSRDLFEKAMEVATFCVVMDANLKKTSIDLIENIRGSGDLWILKHRHNREIKKVKNIETIKNLIVKYLTDNKKIVVSCTTVPQSEQINEHVMAVSKLYDLNLQIKLVNGTQRDERKFFEKIKTNVKEIDVLIHTTTLGPGVNIDVPDYFDNLFVITTNQEGTPTVGDVIQMMGRVREYKDETIFWAHKSINRKTLLPTTIDEICNIENSKFDLAKSLGFMEQHVDKVTKAVTWAPSLNYWKRLAANMQIERNVNMMAFDVLFETQMSMAGYDFVFDKHVFDYKLSDELTVELKEQAMIEKKEMSEDLTNKVEQLKSKVKESAENSREGKASAEDKVINQIAAVERQFNHPDHPDSNNELTGEFGFDIKNIPKQSVKILSFIRMINEPDANFVFECEIKRCDDPSKNFGVYDKPLKFGFIRLALKKLGIEKLEWRGQVDLVKHQELIDIMIEHSEGINALFGGQGVMTDKSAKAKLAGILKSHLGLNIVRDKRTQKNGVREYTYKYTMSNDLQVYADHLKNLKTYKEYRRLDAMMLIPSEPDPNQMAINTMNFEELLSFCQK